jgi:hypothetical protein
MKTNKWLSKKEWEKIYGKGNEIARLVHNLNTINHIELKKWAKERPLIVFGKHEKDTRLV